MIENHMVIETSVDRAREAAAAQAESNFKRELDDAVCEIQDVLLQHVTKISPQRLTVPYVDGAGKMREFSVADLFMDQIGYPNIDTLFYKLMQTDAAKELREAICAKYVDQNAEEIAEWRAAA